MASGTVEFDDHRPQASFQADLRRFDLLDLPAAQAYAAVLTELAEPPVALPVDVTRRESVDTLVATVV